MDPMKLYFDVRDIFRAPRLALSGKKIIIFMQANLIGYAVYLVLNYLGAVVNGRIEIELVNAHGSNAEQGETRAWIQPHRGLELLARGFEVPLQQINPPCHTVRKIIPVIERQRGLRGLHGGAKILARGL